MSTHNKPESVAIGSGLAVEHDYSCTPQPCAVREGPNRYRAEISGTDSGTRIVVWSSTSTYATRSEALEFAICKAGAIMEG